MSHFVASLPLGLFEANRWLLNGLFALAADNLLYAAEQRGLTIGILGALHTCGRQLNWNCHIHLSWTTGGINAHGDWKKMTFALPKVRARWKVDMERVSVSAVGTGVPYAAPGTGPHPG